MSEAPSPREAIKARNALLAVSISEDELHWGPSAVPKYFRWENQSPPAEIRAAMARLDIPHNEQLAHAILLAQHISPTEQRGEAIQRSTLLTYQSITSKGNGYCADYTQVFNGLAYATKLPAREWGISFDGFGGDGHAVNEIYSERHGKWIMIDSFYSFYSIDGETGSPLSVLEFRDKLRLRNPLDSMTIMVIDNEDFGFSSDDALIQYFRRGVDQFYLWLGNNVFEFDDHPAVKAGSLVSRTLEQFFAILAGVHPQIGVVKTSNNEHMILQLKRKKMRVSAYLIVATVAGLFSLVLGVTWQVKRSSLQ